MVKKFFLLLFVAMLNVVAWAEPTFVITPHTIQVGELITYVNYDPGTGKYYGDAGSKGFTEPAVQIKNGDDDITSRYILTYKIGDNEPVNDGRGVSISTDPTTKSSVESNYGQVSLGKHGEIVINISAVKRSGFTDEQAPAVSPSAYTIRIDELTTTHNIVPAFNSTTEPGYVGELSLNTVYNDNKWSAVTSILPKYSVTAGTGVSQMDVTDRFDVTISFEKIGDGTQRITLSDDKTKLSFSEVSGSYIDGAKTGTLTYQFTPKAEYEGIYADATKRIYVKLNEVSSPLPENEKYTLNATLNASSFFQENITTHEGDNLPQINVYKYGLNDAGTGTHDQYTSPVPTLSYQGTVYPQWSTKGGGQWGDFRMVYKIESDESYADDCQYIPFHTSEDNIKPAGQRTGLTIGADNFQMGGLIGTGYAAGLIKVKGYAILENDPWYGATQKALFKQLGTIDENGTNYPYYATVEFYINVMKRKPQVMISPDPKGLVFAVGDVITMNERFDIYGYKSGDDSNGIEGVLVFDPSEDKWSKYGNEVDKLSYSFFISRTQQAGKIAISDWPYATSGATREEQRAAWEAAGGDMYSYRWRYPSPYKAVDKVAIGKGDYIRVTAETDGAEEIDGHWYIKITDDNISNYLVYKGTPSVVDEDNSNHPYLTEDDLEGGIVYNSMKGYGNESWTMTFLQAGEYDIPYLLRQYNHVRWDSSDLKVYRYQVRSDLVAELKLSYYYTVARKGQGENFIEPDANVVLPNLHNLDVTEDFDITYSIPGVTPTHNESYKGENGWDKYEDTTTGTILYTKTGKEEVVIGNTAVGQVTVTAHATKKSSVTNRTYNDVKDKSYVINIVDEGSMAKWEVISNTGRGCVEHDEDPNKVRYTDMNDAYGRMHFLPMSSYNKDAEDEATRRNAGLFYGGTVITGVPGIEMTVGAAPSTVEAATADWLAIVPSAAHLEDTKKCCSHEDATVVVKPTLPIEFDETEELPIAGAFYKFEPKVNGFLTVDAKLSAGHTIVLIAYINGKKVDDTVTPDADITDNYTFQMPLIAGETYYLYDVTNSTDLNIHGFSYQPAFLKGTEKKDSWSEPYTATTFKNSLSNGIPRIVESSYDHINFSVIDDNDPARAGGNVDNYLLVGAHDGKLDPKGFTMDGDGIFYLKVNAAVESTLNTGSGLGHDYSDCTKNPYYYINILDIPTYKVVKVGDSMSNIVPGSKVSTTNIKTDITMTFGALGNPNGDKTAFIPNPWEFKKATGENSYHSGEAGVADRIGNPTKVEGKTWDDNPAYNKTIDGFLSFYCGKEDAFSEDGMCVLQNGEDDQFGRKSGYTNGDNYSYGSGTGYELNGTKYFDTTYRMPARGTFLKFEPRESGTLLVYLVQNGSCDYFDGVNIATESKQYGYVKWRPLYIVDETGKPVEMVNSFDNVSQYLPMGTDLLNAGSYTEGVSRCSKNPAAITGAVDKMDGCSFDWSLFKGTPADRQRLFDAWPNEGERESIIRLDNGGFAIPHKAYVRYTFNVKAGKTYFVFQVASKPEFGGFSFVPEGFPYNCKFTINSTAKKGTGDDEYVYDPTAPYQFNATNQEKNASGEAATSEVTYATGSQTAADAQSVITDNPVASRDIHFTWDTSATRFTGDMENINVTINDRRTSEITGDPTLKPRTFKNGVWESICLPFSVSEQEMTRVFGSDYLLVTCDGLYEDTKDLLFVRHANRYVEAGRPYLLKPTKDGVFSFRNVTIEGGQNVSTFGGSVNKLPNPARFNLGINNDEFVFKGTYMRETVPAGSYFVYSDDTHEDALYKYESALKIGGYRAYFQKQTLNPGASLSNQLNVLDVMFLVEDSGEVTEVLAISEDGTVNSLPKNAGVYTVNGQKVSDSPLGLKTLPSGLYIINGKKYIK